MDSNQTMKKSGSYRRLAVMIILSFVSMYVVMYVMVNSFENVYLNFNQFYMAGLMTTVMVLIEMCVMSKMYTDKKLNNLINSAAVLLFLLFIVLVRNQSLIGDEQFLKSMIPHHASALLMCEKADIKDPEINALCKNILAGQQKEIDQMKLKLESINH